MSDPPRYTPSAEFEALWPGISGNQINGVGESSVRSPAPFFWHPPEQHPYGPLWQISRRTTRRDPAVRAMIESAFAHPPLAPIAPTRDASRSAEQWTEAAHAFALAHEADLFGVARMQPTYVFQGYEIREPWVVMLGFGHDYDQLAQVPGTADNSNGPMEIGRQYARGTRASFALANWMRAQGFESYAYPGPGATALVHIPAAIAAGFGELGKHGSIINREFGSGFRLAGVTTTMPLVANVRDEFGADDFCLNCQACTRACPPDAISDEKTMVRGVEKWYVDFDKCIPYFVENAACGICIAICPWTRPSARPKLLETMARRRATPQR
jgi:epoxyqueuosine reductase